MPAEAKTFVTDDGREFTFLFDIDGIIAAEDCANRVEGNANIQQIVAGAMNARMGYLRALIYGGLKSRQPSITRAEAWELVESDGEKVGQAMWAALFAAMPVKEGEASKAGANPPKAAGGTGKRSSPPGSKKASPKPRSASKRRAATR
jgi:hypothetical protein